MYCRSVFALDYVLGMRYLSLCIPASMRIYCIRRPRDRNFIVAEEPEAMDFTQTPGPQHRYAIFLLYKRGLTTEKALKLISKRLGLSWKDIGYAGLKDAEATTFQLVSVPVNKLGKALSSISTTRTLLLRNSCGIRLLGFSNKDIKRGKLRGNRFYIILEPAMKDSNSLKELEKLKSIQLIAYYGYQRFGLRRPNTHIAYYNIVRGLSFYALKDILDSPFPDESLQAISWRLRLGGSIISPRGISYEEKLLKCVMRRGVFSGCFNELPIVSREIYLSSLRAWLFNEYLSRRIEYGAELGKVLRGEKLSSDKRPLAPIPKDLNDLSGESYTLYKEIYKDYNIDYSLRLQANTTWRPTYTQVKELAIRTLKIDGETVIVVSFFLEKGMYASIVLREIARTPLCI